MEALGPEGKRQASLALSHNLNRVFVRSNTVCIRERGAAGQVRRERGGGGTRFVKNAINLKPSTTYALAHASASEKAKVWLEAEGRGGVRALRPIVVVVAVPKKITEEEEEVQQQHAWYAAAAFAFFQRARARGGGCNVRLLATGAACLLATGFAYNCANDSRRTFQAHSYIHLRTQESKTYRPA